jgi:hypothetical protein
MYWAFIACVLAPIVPYALFRVYQWRSRQRARRTLRKTIATEIEDLTRRINAAADQMTASNGGDAPILQDPKYLTTLLTVIVKKCDGKIYLTEGDFINCSLDDFVSVLFNSDDRSLLLTSSTVMPLMDDDETIYH